MASGDSPSETAIAAIGGSDSSKQAAMSRMSFYL